MTMLVAFFLSQIHYLCTLACTVSVITFHLDVCKITLEQHEFVVYRILLFLILIFGNFFCVIKTFVPH